MSIVSNECIDTGSRLGDLLWVEFVYTFGNGFVLNDGHRKAVDMPSAIIECASLVPDMERQVVEQSREAALRSIGNVGVIAEEITPDFPDELPAFDADESVDTRRRGFHRWLLREVWPQDLRVVEDQFLDVWQWIDQMTAPNKRVYLDVSTETANEIQQRMGNAFTMSTLFDQDVPGDIP